MSRTYLNKETQQDPILSKIAELEARIFSLETKGKKKILTDGDRASAMGCLFLPELDYLVQVTLRRNEFRRGRLTSQFKLDMGPKTLNTKSVSGFSYTYGYYAEKVGSAHVFIPKAAITRDMSKYNVSHSTDYRFLGAKPIYMTEVDAGYKDSMGEDKKINGTTSAQLFDWSRPIDKMTITATRYYWETMKDDEEEVRICTRETMFEVLDAMEAGDLRAGYVPWIVQDELVLGDPNLEVAPKRIGLAKKETGIETNSKGNTNSTNNKNNAVETNEDDDIDSMDWIENIDEG